jgi:hypothetical protein
VCHLFEAVKFTETENVNTLENTGQQKFGSMTKHNRGGKSIEILNLISTIKPWKARLGRNTHKVYPPQNYRTLWAGKFRL